MYLHLFEEKHREYVFDNLQLENTFKKDFLKSFRNRKIILKIPLEDLNSTYYY